MNTLSRPSPVAVLADGDAGEYAADCQAGEPRALVGVEHFRPAVTSPKHLLVSRRRTQPRADVALKPIADVTFL
jgi:hypothetical protein